MSESIWNSEIEEGLKKFFNSFLLNSDGSPIKVKVRKPDDDFMEEKYPVIYLQSLQQSLNTVRYDPTRVKEISRDEATHTVIKEEAPIAMDCIYQVDFYTLYQREINSILQKFLANTNGGRYFNLAVKDQSGNDWDLLALRRDKTNVVRRTDYFDERTRLFHAAFAFKVQTQLNENIRREGYYVTATDLSNTGETEGLD